MAHLEEAAGVVLASCEPAHRLLHLLPVNGDEFRRLGEGFHHKSGEPCGTVLVSLS
jgi:hypothetical protein